MPKTLQPIHIITSKSASNMTGTTVVTSNVVDTRYLTNLYLQISYTGTPNGSFSIQASMDYVPNPAGGAGIVAGTWIDIGANIANAAGGAGAVGVNIANEGYAFLRLVYTNTSSTGSLDVWAGGKGF